MGLWSWEGREGEGLQGGKWYFLTDRYGCGKAIIIYGHEGPHLNHCTV